MFEGVSVPGAAHLKQSQLVFPAKREGIPRMGLGVAKPSLGGWEGSRLAEEGSENVSKRGGLV